MSKFNFNSQICSNLEQSRRLLALGLKKETADMCWTQEEDGFGELRWYCRVGTFTQSDAEIGCFDYIPAWSLHRLIEMMPNKIRIYDDSVSLIVSNTKVQYYSHDVEYSDYLSCAGKWEDGNVYHNIISCIEWLIKEGYFNKEYLEE